MKISTFSFDKNHLDDVSSKTWGMKWPVVYILNNEQDAYVGETIQCVERMKQHLHDERRQDMENINVIFDERFNKSAVIDIESFLIKYMTADGKFKLQNENNGIQNHNYYNRDVYRDMYGDIWKELRKLGLIKNSIKRIENKNDFKYSPYKELTNDQVSTMMDIFADLNHAPEIKTFFVHGGAGTGKSVLAVYMIKLIQYIFSEDYALEGEFDDDVANDLQYMRNHHESMKIALVVPMKSFRKTLKKVFSNIKGLSRTMVLTPSEVVKDTYDLILVDEAHRLRKKKNITGFQHKQFERNNAALGLEKDATELDWILSCSRHQILFYDHDQSVKETDVDESVFKELMRDPRTKQYNLSSQLRVLGGNDYIRQIEDILYLRAEEKKIFDKYEFLLFDHIDEMVQEILNREKELELCRVVAGYAWPWKTHHKTLSEIENKNLYDIEIKEEGGEIFHRIWNRQDEDWVNSENAINEVGCIHTIQGYDLNVAGVILGEEIGYDEVSDEIIIRKDKYFDMFGKRATEDEDLKEYILHIYKVLLTRGIHGTYVYACDKGLRNYLKKYIPVYERNDQREGNN